MQRMHLIASALVMTAVRAASQTAAAGQQPPVNWNAKAPLTFFWSPTSIRSWPGRRASLRGSTPSSR